MQYLLSINLQLYFPIPELLELLESLESLESERYSYEHHQFC